MLWSLPVRLVLRIHTIGTANHVEKHYISIVKYNFYYKSFLIKKIKCKFANKYIKRTPTSVDCFFWTIITKNKKDA